MGQTTRRQALLALGLLLPFGLLLATLLPSLRSGKAVFLQIDGETRTVTTDAATVGDVLAEAGVWLDSADLVSPTVTAPAAPGSTIVVQRAGLVAVAAAGQTHLLRRQPEPAASLLGGLGLTLGPGDALWSDGRPLADSQARASNLPMHLELLRAVPVTIQEAGSPPVEARTAARTVGAALWALGYRLYQGDQVTPALDAPLAPGLNIGLQRSQPVRVQADGQLVSGRTRAATVGQALAELGVPLIGEDYSLPAEDQPLPQTGLISVVRVREEVLTEQQLIPYETVYQPLPEVEIDNVFQVQAGRPGVLRRLTRVRYENGAEVSRVAEGEVLVQSPQPLIMGYGTQIVIRTLDTPDGPVEYWRAYTMYATSYAAKFTNRTPGTPNYGRTASGKIVTRGLVAIDRSLMPFGTRMYVPGYGFAEAADTGGGVRGRFIDLGFDDWNYVAWYKVVMVYFLTPVPPADQIRWIIPSTVP